MPVIMPFHSRGIEASRLALGCMRFGGDWDYNPITQELVTEGHAAVEAALSIGINFFDLADIYTRGKAEKVFGQILKERPALREQIILQSKCGIRLVGDSPGPQRFDLSLAHILASVDGILDRLGAEYLDILLLHRPDPLMQPEEIAEAIRQLKAAGKVKHFGVSNMSADHIRLLQAFTDEPLIVNQLEMSLAKHSFVDAGLAINREFSKQNVFPHGTMEYCQLNRIQLQAWGPLAQGIFSGRSLDGQSPQMIETAAEVQKLAEAKETTPEAIVLAWLMKHPAGIQPVIGSIKPERILACRDAAAIELSREEWYTLFSAACGRRM